MSAIGYEWGTMQHPEGKDKSPDNLAHSTISQSFITYSSGFRNQKPYSAAPINSIVYPVYGGMEDWAYAAGWDTSLNVVCNGKSSTSRAIPPPNRVVTFLVETSDAKTPSSSEMGQDKNILSLSELNKYSGHIPRNTRLSLVAIDTIQPYVCISSLSYSPSTTTSSTTFTTSTTSATATPATFDISWYVGGGYNIFKTWISWHLLPSKISSNLNTITSQRIKSGILEDFILNISPNVPYHPHEKLNQLNHTTPFASGWFSGNARWKWSNPFNKNEGLFQVKGLTLPKNLSQFLNNPKNENKKNITLLLIAWAEVDSDWGQPGQGFPNSIEDSTKNKMRRLKTLFPPQSHLSNARSNPKWNIINSIGQVKVQGRRYFPSDPILITIDIIKGNLRGKQSSINIGSYVEDCSWWDRKSLV